MNKIIVIINGYQEEMMLPAALETVRSSLPKAEIAYADGAYQGWVNAVKIDIAHQYEYGHVAIGDGMARFTSPISTDATFDILHKYNVEHILYPDKDEEGNYKPWPSEYAKRNKFFSLGKPGDIYFWLDGDERIRGTFNIESVKEEAYNVMLSRDDKTNPYPVLRIYKHQDGIKCEGAHHFIWIGERLLERDKIPTLDGVSLYHEYNKRAEQDRFRALCKGAYYRWLMQDERLIRAKYGL